MNRVFVAIALAGLSASPTFAADIANRLVYTKAPIATQTYDWTGFYVGVSTGLGLARDSTRQSAAGSTPNANVGPLGAIGGAQAGYNWQWGGWVLGLETDIQASGMRDSYFCGALCTPASMLTVDQRLSWFGTTRGRVGLGAGPVFTYVTGGLAYGGVKTAYATNTGAAPLSLTLDDTKTGYTYGSGVEASVGGNWTAKVEYLYLRLGQQSGVYGGRTVTSDIREHTVRAGLNYRIGNDGKYSEPTTNWTGFYLGGNGGSAVGRNRTDLNSAPLVVSESYNLMPHGYLGGVQAGYNWQSGNVVYGFEGDMQGALQKDNKNCMFTCTMATPQFATVDQRMFWLGTARGRLGYAVGSTLFYGTTGLAYGGFKNRIALADGLGNSFNGKFDHVSAGWTLGGGIETPFDVFGLLGKNWTGTTEYLYVDLGKTTDNVTLGAATYSIRSDLTEHLFRTSLNYHFNAPVTAKY